MTPLPPRPAVFGLTIPTVPSGRPIVQRVPKTIAGIRAKSGRRAPKQPGHYLTDHRESRQIDKALDAALERIKKRQGITPDHPPAACPMRKPRRAGLQNLCFRNFEKGAQDDYPRMHGMPKHIKDATRE